MLKHLLVLLENLCPSVQKPKSERFNPHRDMVRLPLGRAKKKTGPKPHQHRAATTRHALVAHVALVALRGLGASAPKGSVSKKTHETPKAKGEAVARFARTHIL